MAKKPEGTNFDKLLEELNGKKTGAGGENQSAPVQKKSGFVTLIGRPNVGKSTLMNHLIGQKIAITSDKPQTVAEYPRKRWRLWLHEWFRTFRRGLSGILP